MAGPSRPIRSLGAFVCCTVLLGATSVGTATSSVSGSAVASPEPRVAPQATNASSLVDKYPPVTLLNHVTTKDKVVFITVDDGSAYSDELAKLLDSRKIPITAFLLTKWSDRIQAFWLKRQNITYENHTHDHFYQPPLSFERQKEDICKASRIVKQITGSSPRFFRPPGGGYTTTTLRAVAACGIKYVVMWKASASKGVLYTDGNKPLQPGDIVLLHAIRSLPRTLEVVLRAAAKQGLRPALLRDYLK